MKEYIQHIIQQHGTEKASVLPILQAIQSEYNYIPELALKAVCDLTLITPAEIVGVATFYAQFRFRPAGRHTVKVCTGTACHVKGADIVYESFRRSLNLKGDDDTDHDGTFTLTKVNCLGCCSLAPAVQIDEVTYGHVTSATASKILQDFIKRNSEETPQNKVMLDGEPNVGEIRIGLGSCCVASGSDDVRVAVEKVVHKEALPVNVKQVGCVGMCHQVPMMEVLPANGVAHYYAKVQPADVGSIIRKHFRPEGVLGRLRRRFQEVTAYLQEDELTDDINRYSLNIREPQVSAFLGNQLPIATEHRGILHPTDIQEYLSYGGFNGLKKALKMNPSDVIAVVKESGQRGRGGAGFPTAIKWEVTAQATSETKYLICNGDEGDPGAFMDRMLLESYPYRVIEGMLIAAHTTGATHGYFYIRAEYPLAVVRVREALEHCRSEGFLGENICDTSFSFDIDIYEGAGAFVCGEETALIASIEGKRGFPRLRPPYPAAQGLWHQPTLINNTETFAQIPFIMERGAEAFSSVGSLKSKGTKVFSLAGKINRGGLIEVPMGITIRTIVEEIGGGVQNGRKLKAVQVGGPSGGCIPEHLADHAVDFESLQEVGAIMGSGGLVVLDERDCMVDIARYFLAFTQQESCGKCTFCRIGTRRMLDILESLCVGNGTQKDLEELKYLAVWTQKGSLCGLGKTAPNPVLSTLHYFYEEYTAHITGICPAGKCAALITYRVTSRCIGCTICAQNCPVKAIPFTPHQQHVINTNLCVKCDNCRQVCPEEAIEVC